MNSSNSNPTRLTSDGRIKMDPCFIQGGSEIIFATQETPTLISLMRLKLDDGSVERLHPQVNNYSEFEPTFSADAQVYAFVQCHGNQNLKVIIRDTRANRDAVFQPSGGFASVRRPSIAQDGSGVVFSLPNNNGQQIEWVNTQAQQRKALTQSSLNGWPAFAPDGRRIAFASSREGNFDIYVMDVDGGQVQRLTNSPGLDIRPAWSPDGEQIAFTSNRDGNYEIYIMRADGSAVRRITQNVDRDDYAAWHPDGNRLVFVGERAGRSDLYLVEV